MAPSTTSSSLTGCVIALVGVHTVCLDLKNHTAAELKTYIADRGGAFSSKITDECTHLVANQKQYDAKGAKVKQAAKNDNIKVVSYDWLVKSFSSKKKVNDSGYLLESAATAPVDGSTSAPKRTSQSKKRKRGEPSDVGDDDDDDDDNAKAAPQTKKQATQHISAPKKSSINVPVDEFCPVRGSVNVFQGDDGTIYDVTLNQTNAGNNNNKFYRIQLLVDPKTKGYRVWTRWGRVGEAGQNAMFEFQSLDSAFGQFEKKFRDKTGYKWESRHEPAKKGKYTYIERNYEESGGEEEGEGGRKDENPPGAGTRRSSKNSIDSNEIPAVESKLHQAVQNLIKFIFDTDMFNSTMASMDYDAHKMPLGKLSKRTLTQGYQILKDIAALLGDHSLAQSQYSTQFGAALADLSNQYFSTIPHAFGRNRPPVIQDDRLMKKEIELIESLTDMQLANEIIKGAKGDKQKDIHLIDRQYGGLEMEEMTPLSKDSSEYQQLQDYLVKSAGKTHNVHYKVQDIFRIERQGERDRFANSPYANVSNSDRRLLWHGSRSTNYGGILSQGLRIAPKEAPVSGYMFGKGVYLADISTKSANYCWASGSGGTGLLLLCEAELGTPPLKLANSDYSAEENAKNQGCISTWGVGLTAPKGWKDAGCVHKDLEGVKIPDVSVEPGPANNGGTYLQYNEYIVYDVSQVRLRYLLRVKM